MALLLKISLIDLLDPCNMANGVDVMIEIEGSLSFNQVGIYNGQRYNMCIFFLTTN